MSLTEASRTGVIANQVRYKFKAYLDVFATLVIVQLLGVLLSFNGTAMSSYGGVATEMEVQYYTADVVMGVTIVWGFISSLLLTTKAYREDAFAFVTNRMTSHFSSIIFIGIFSVAGGITAVLSGFLLQVLMYYGAGYQDVLVSGGYTDPLYMLTGTTAAVLFIFLFSALGYFVGMLGQLHWVWVIVVPATIIAVTNVLNLNAMGVFFEESSFPMFVIKAVLSIAVLFTVSGLISNRLEVKR
ncbi:hypothetical protein HUG20_17440 [Salicibibacter cibi]|uniref:Uncharacterized protein n=1 Tax=Salicibibacter cibi TaxID=2743001 RepID=A0A7T6ZDJ4_9BACI|nr:hypothetical protein [Salicibibacter cibi]QQK81519.1 hypothetical protein HUG20_17440 [Salicibibacter cibi]